MQNLDWHDILDTLKEQKCVLFLGRSAYQAVGGGDMSKALQQHLDVHNVENPNIRLYNADGFFLFRKNRYRRRVIAQMKDFYNQSFPETEALFTRLAQIPFNIIVTLTADNILARTFDTNGFDYYSDFYFKKRKASDHFELPTKQKPLIYNLLGNIEEPESLVLTHQDFFDYLNSVFVGNSMNDDLQETLESAERYIFLGLPYEKWYFQLLLRVLSLQSNSGKLQEVERLALKEFENPNLHQIYATEFKIEFIPSDITAFLHTLYQKCADGNILKALPKVDTRLAHLDNLSGDHIQNLVAQARMNDAFLHLHALLQQKVARTHPKYTEWIVLQNRYNLLRQREHLGTIDSRDLSVENNQVTEQFLQLLTKTLAL